MTHLDLQKRFPIYHVCPKYLAALLCGSAIPRHDPRKTSEIWSNAEHYWLTRISANTASRQRVETCAKVTIWREKKSQSVTNSTLLRRVLKLMLNLSCATSSLITGRVNSRRKIRKVLATRQSMASVLISAPREPAQEDKFRNKMLRAHHIYDSDDRELHESPAVLAIS